MVIPLRYHYGFFAQIGRFAMADFLLRDIDADVLESLRSAAANHGRSLQAEIKTVLRDHTSLAARRDAFMREVDEFLAAEGPAPESAAPCDVIRRDRDRGHRPWHGF